jgi:glutaredoxin-like YruB-family protein
MIKLKIFLCIILAAIFLNGSALAKMYKWVDENGVTHFSDTPPAKVAPSTKIKAFPTYDNPYKNIRRPKPKAKNTVRNSEITPSKPKTRDTVQSSETTPSTSEKPKKSKKPEVELYVTNWCPWCNKAKSFFRSRGIPFTEYNIEKNKEAARRKNKLTNRRGVPFAVVNSQLIHGYSEASYKQALGSY